MTALAAVIAGVAAALGHAPFGLWWISLPGLAVMIWLVATARRPGWVAWVSGAAYFGVTMHWIVEPFLVDIETHGWMAPGALLLLAGGLALFWALAGHVSLRLANSASERAVAFIFCLTAAEMIRGVIFTGFPWALPAYIWAETPVLGVVSLTGSYGLVLLTLFGAALPTIMRTAVLGITLAASVFAALFVVGFYRLDPERSETRSLGTVRLVQPNVPQAEKWQRDKVSEHLDRLMSLTGAPGEGIDQVVWPEAAVVFPLDQAGPVLEQAAREAPGTAEVILGINRRNAANEWFNALAIVGSDGQVRDTYDKVHLVPFGEYIPFRIDFLRAMAASSGFGFTPGDRVRLVETPLGSALPLICYEGIFPRHIFKPDDRAEYILLITNDAWFGTFSGPYQHLDQARFRAVEHGLPVVRVANTGISTVISHVGGIGDALPLGESGFLDQPVVTTVSPTLYAVTGDWPLRMILVFGVAVLIYRQRRNAIANGASSV